MAQVNAEIVNLIHSHILNNGPSAARGKFAVDNETEHVHKKQARPFTSLART